MNKKELRKKYFNKGANALSRIISDYQGYYCCPLCNHLFTLHAIYEEILTIEHAPPESVGGKPLALTCKKCNSKSGDSIDAAIANRDKLTEAIKAITGQQENYQGYASLKMAEESINVRIEVNEGIISIKPPLKINNPEKLDSYKKNMMNLHNEGKWDGEKFTITPTDRFHMKYSKIGDLKSAFIICFALFGYRYALNKKLSPVREQILNYKADIINCFWLASDPNVEKKYFICLLEKPIPAIAVKLDKATILLPWFEGPENFYQHIEKNFNLDKNINFSGEFLKWPQGLEMRMDYPVEQQRI